MIPSGLFKNIAKGTANTAWKGLGGAGRAAAIGAGIGGAYGAVSSNTSVLGGAVMGAGMGLGVRYSQSGIRATSRYARGPISTRGVASQFVGGAGRRMKRDFGISAIKANKGFNSFKGLFV